MRVAIRKFRQIVVNACEFRQRQDYERNRGPSATTYAHRDKTFALLQSKLKAQ